MVHQNVKSRLQMAILATVFAMFCTFLLIRRSFAAKIGDHETGKITQRIVQVQTKDDVADAGALYTPPKSVAKPFAVIWIHGATTNFYDPTYVAISRALAKRGFTVITGNTRMHDLGNVETYRAGKRVRGGTYWGIPSEQVQDIAAWIDFSEGLGFKRIVLVGHSAGANAVREYQAQTHDHRVEGLVLASGDVRPDTRVPPSEWVSTAKQDIADGRPEEMVQGPFLSAATFLDILNRPPGLKDFFGELSPDAGVARIHCPLLAVLGTDGDVGNEEDLKRIKFSTERLPTHPRHFDTALIQGADHMYAGHEDRLAQVIASWSDAQISSETDRSGVPKNQ